LTRPSLGGFSKPLNKIKITNTKPKTTIGPTKQNLKQKNRSNAVTVTKPKQRSWLDRFLNESPPGLYPEKPKKRKKSYREEMILKGGLQD